MDDTRFVDMGDGASYPLVEPFAVYIWLNSDNRFCEAEVGNRVQHGGKVVVYAKSTAEALERAWAVANRQGCDATGTEWSRYNRSASVGDIFLAVRAAEDDDWMKGTLYEVESVGFGARPEWVITYPPGAGTGWVIARK